MHPTINTWWAQIHQEEIRQEAAKHRTRPCGPGLRERLSLRLGTLLIAAGQRIRAPYEPVLDRRPEAYGPRC